MLDDELEDASAVDELPELVPSLQAATPMSTATSSPSTASTSSRFSLLPSYQTPSYIVWFQRSTR